MIDLNPYQVAARLQTHPIVQKTDIRRKFPDEIHLIISEHQPVALLQISQQTKRFFICVLIKNKVRPHWKQSAPAQTINL